MKFSILSFILLFTSTVTVYAAPGYINLPDSGDYFQVQDSVTYATKCEGNITGCSNVEIGIQYIVINHTNGKRGFLVAGGLPNKPPVERESITIPGVLASGNLTHYLVRETCPIGTSDCIASCDIPSHVPIGGACEAYTAASSNFNRIIAATATFITDKGFSCRTADASSKSVQVHCIGN